MTQVSKQRPNERRREDSNESTKEFGGNNRPPVTSNTRTVTSSREPNPTDAYAPTFSPTGARGTGTPTSGPTEDEIRRRAYEIYQSRGGEPGREQEDWAQAERELRQKRKATK